MTCRGVFQDAVYWARSPAYRRKRRRWILSRLPHKGGATLSPDLFYDGGRWPAAGEVAAGTGGTVRHCRPPGVDRACAGGDVPEQLRRLISLRSLPREGLAAVTSRRRWRPAPPIVWRRLVMGVPKPSPKGSTALWCRQASSGVLLAERLLIGCRPGSGC